MSHYYEACRSRNQGIFDLSILGLKSLIILNGGAIVALFTLLGHFDHLIVQPSWLWKAFGAFVLGLTSVMIAIVLAYFAQNEFMRVENGIGEALYAEITGSISASDVKSHEARGTVLLWGAIVGVLISLAFFVIGAGLASYAVTLRA